MGSNWRWRSQVGIWSSVTFVNWLHSLPERTRSGQSDTSRYAIDGCHHWKPGHENARKFGMQRCPHIGIAAQQHVDMLLVVWVSSLHLCPVQEWFWHEALVCGCLITREKNTENASGSGQAQGTFLAYPFFHMVQQSLWEQRSLHRAPSRRLPLFPTTWAISSIEVPFTAGLAPRGISLAQAEHFTNSFWIEEWNSTCHDHHGSVIL